MAKEKNIELLKKFLLERPAVSFEDSKSFPSEETIYTMSGLKRFFRSQGLSNTDLDDALYQLQSDKKYDLKSVQVYNHTYQQKFPYFYTGEVEDIKSLIESLESKSQDLVALNARSFKSDDNLKKAVRKKKVKND